MTQQKQLDFHGRLATTANDHKREDQPQPAYSAGNNT
jgi:hypothetical protein